jgi:hypothetical protein
MESENENQAQQRDNMHGTTENYRIRKSEYGSPEIARIIIENCIRQYFGENYNKSRFRSGIESNAVRTLPPDTALVSPTEEGFDGG